MTLYTRSLVKYGGSSFTPYFGTDSVALGSDFDKSTAGYETVLTLNVTLTKECEALLSLCGEGVILGAANTIYWRFNVDTVGQMDWPFTAANTWFPVVGSLPISLSAGDHTILLELSLAGPSETTTFKSGSRMDLMYWGTS